MQIGPLVTSEWTSSLLPFSPPPNPNPNPNPNPQRKRIKPCFRKLCETCGKLIHTSNFVISKVHKRCFPVKPFHNLPMTYQRTRLVYLIQCDKCQKQYVGQTIQTLHTRMNHHIQHIKKKTFSKMWWHFNKEHSIHDVRVIPLQQIDGKLPLEALWIKRLGTMQPLGMNFVLKDTQQRTH